jgi:hypothetical protein
MITCTVDGGNCLCGESRISETRGNLLTRAVIYSLPASEGGGPRKEEKTLKWRGLPSQNLGLFYFIFCFVYIK